MEARCGQSDSYRQLLENITPIARWNTRHILSGYGLDSLSEDVTQDVLLAVHLKLHTYDDKQSFLPWLRAIIKYKTIDMVRRQKIQWLTNDIDLDLISGGSAQEYNDAVTDLDKLMVSLPPLTRDLIYDLKIDGQSVDSLAKKYRLSPSNVKVKIHRGLMKLARIVAISQGDDS